MFLSYLKRHYKIILLFLWFSLIFAVVFSLYSLPTEPVLYACVLCAVFGIVLFIISYIKYSARHKALFSLRSNITVSLDELPEPKGLLEEDYQQLLKILNEYSVSIGAKADIERQEMLDYYTMWVHQIKTPISAMRLLLQAGESESAPALEAELFRIERYVEMVLSYLRLDSISSDYVLKEYDLDVILCQCIRKYAKMFILKKLPLKFDETNLSIMTDEKWLSFVIEQLLSNALKYTFSGKIHIYSKGYVLVISDTGIGISSEDLPRIFEKGFTGFNGRSDKKSTGLGLYLCRRVCDNLGHRLTVSSTPGVGTELYLDLTPGNKVIE